MSEVEMPSIEAIDFPEVFNKLHYQPAKIYNFRKRMRVKPFEEALSGDEVQELFLKVWAFAKVNKWWSDYPCEYFAYVFLGRILTVKNNAFVLRPTWKTILSNGSLLAMEYRCWRHNPSDELKRHQKKVLTKQFTEEISDAELLQSCHEIWETIKVTYKNWTYDYFISFCVVKLLKVENDQIVLNRNWKMYFRYVFPDYEVV